MEAEPLKCPGCGAKMREVAAPDVTTDECEACGGIWLDQGELNVLATGSAGDIEYCAARHVVADDRAPERDCPVCAQRMVNVTLLGHSDLILDLCEKCHGFYLDRGEVEAMNAELQQQALLAGGDEFRGTIGDHFVRLDKLSTVKMEPILLGLGEAPAYVESLRVSVFFREPLGIGLRLTKDSLTKRLTKALKLSRAQDIRVGDAAFDKAFVVEADGPEAVERILTAEVREALLAWHRDPPHLFGKSGVLEVLDNRLVYDEGPYLGEVAYDAVADPSGVVSALRQIAGAFDAASKG